LISYAQSEKAFIEAVEEGIKAAGEGRLVDQDTVVTEIERRYRSR
jgi:predicted transcriptional regulator